MDLKQYRSKLIGSKDERAVSPVIGVILMVAITVILAAVIAAFVLDMGQSQQQEAQGAADIEVDSDAGTITVEVISLQNADQIDLGGYSAAVDGTGDWSTSGSTTGLQVGDSVTLTYSGDASSNTESGSITAVAVLNEGQDDEVRTQVGSKDFEFDEDYTP